VTQYRALAELKALTRPSHAAGKDTSPSSSEALKPAPLIERLNRNEYIENVDLTNLVNYPPRLRPVPVKPLFFDLAWNYIVYPSQKGDLIQGSGRGGVNGKVDDQESAAEKQDQTQKPAKKGWFGFGR